MKGFDPPTGLEKLAGLLEKHLTNTWPFIYEGGVWSGTVSITEDIVMLAPAHGAGEMLQFQMSRAAATCLFHQLGDQLEETHGMNMDSAMDANDMLVRQAKQEDDGCTAITTGSGIPEPGSTTSVVLVATSKNPERLASLHALHQAWYANNE